MEVFMLQPELTDPRFLGFVFAPHAKSFFGNEFPHRDFDVVNIDSYDWTPRKLSAIWHAQPVERPVAAFNDYPCVGIIPAFSRRAVDALGEMLTSNGELLPLKSDIGEYFAFNVHTKIDCLNEKKSTYYHWEPRPSQIVMKRFDIDPTKLGDATIFKIPQQPNEVLVTTRFKERAEKARLNGLVFIKVWPLPEDSDRLDEQAKYYRSSKFAKISGETLILRLRLKNHQPDAYEQELAKQAVDSLIQELKVNSLEEEYWGFLETYEFADGEFRMFCTCPSCDKLAEHLFGWIADVPWDSDIAIVKRYGHLYDKVAKEIHLIMRGEQGF